jgi:hypothetical protein
MARPHDVRGRQAAPVPGYGILEVASFRGRGVFAIREILPVQGEISPATRRVLIPRVSRFALKWLQVAFGAMLALLEARWVRAPPDSASEDRRRRIPGRLSPS